MKFNLIPRRFRNPYVTTAVLIVWCGMFGFYLMDLQTYAEAEKWPIVSAELVSGEVEEIKRRRGRSSKYRLNLEYRYEVAGKVYQNDKVQVLDDDFSERSTAEKALKSYQALPALTVYYSESNPATFHPPTKDSQAFGHLCCSCWGWGPCISGDDHPGVDSQVEGPTAKIRIRPP